MSFVVRRAQPKGVASRRFTAGGETRADHQSAFTVVSLARGDAPLRKTGGSYAIRLIRV